MFSSFVAERLPRCEDGCPYDRECESAWALFATGEIRPTMDWCERPDVWARWPRCPRRCMDLVAVLGGELVPVAEAARWAVECGAHRRRVPARTEQLCRIWTQIQERPVRLREHIAAERAKAKRGKAR